MKQQSLRLPRLGVPLLLCQVAAWALLVPTGWYICQRPCDEAAHNVTVVPARAALGPAVPHWAAAVIEAMELGARDASVTPQALRQILTDDSATSRSLAHGIRNLVASHVRKAVAPEARKRQAGDVSTLCPQGRPPVAIVPTQDLVLPVLESLGGRVLEADPDGVVGGAGKAPAGRGGKMLPPPPALSRTANRWGVPMPNVTAEVEKGRRLSVDDLVYGYDMVFEAMHLFSYVSWGRVPMQQDPADALAIADLLGRLQPDCFLELGTNTGGGAVFYAEVMAGYVDRPLVVTVDVHEPTKNWDRFAGRACPHCVPVTCHPAWHKPGLIHFVKGYTQDPSTVAEVERVFSERQCRHVVLMHDSDHRRPTIEADLQLYQHLVTVGSYIVVQDTKLSRMRGATYQTLEAVHSFLDSPAGKGRFVVDKTFEYLLFSHHHDGFLQRVA